MTRGRPSVGAGRRRSVALALAAGAIVVAGPVGCGDREAERGGRGLGSAIWPSAAPPWETLRTPEAEAALRAAGVTNQLVEAARVGAEGHLELEPVRPPLPGLSAVLVVGSEWAALESLSRGDADELAEEILLMVVEWESARTTVRGIHLHPSGALEDRESGARSISRLAGALPERLSLSLHLGAELLAGEDRLGGLAAAADSLVCEIYGQPWSEPDRADGWDLEGSLERARRADSLGRPFLAALALEGRILDPRSGETVARGLDAETLGSRALSVEGAFSYEGFHRQLLDLTPQRALDALGGREAVRLEPRRVVRLARPTAQHVAALTERLRGQQLDHLEGILWLGGGDANAAAVPVARLAAVVSGALDSEPVLRVEREAAARRLRVELHNGADPTAWADRDYNLIEIDLEGAVFGSIELGGFARMELDDRDAPADASPMERLRRADRLRLYFVALEPGGIVGSGDLQVRPSSTAWRAEATARVLGPAGAVVAIRESGSHQGKESNGESENGRKAGARR
ncbi:MAG TPA: hypothetical protein VMT85_20025 [Thermoanaerobaculia bacterium]|nr:hypothetical protein [Thermoanaerobaculia bacterium]